jgi:PiT family inorganic phosphate transporter
MKTMGDRVTKLNSAGGFVAQTVSAAVIEIMSFIGAPISTTQVITSAVMGVGSAKRIKSVRWKIAGDIALTWIVTLPVAAVLGGLSVFVIQLFV